MNLNLFSFTEGLSFFARTEGISDEVRRREEQRRFCQVQEDLFVLAAICSLIVGGDTSASRAVYWGFIHPFDVCNVVDLTIERCCTAVMVLLVAWSFGVGVVYDG